MTLYDKVYDLFHQWLNTTDEDFEEFCKWISNQNPIILNITGSSFSTNSTTPFTYTGNVFVDWGDNTGLMEYTSGALSHTYTSSGNYTAKIYGNITNIDHGCFAHCTGLTNIIRPDTVTSIGNMCFQNCATLTSVTFPNTLTSIGGICFWGCPALTSITIPYSVTNITFPCFWACNNLTEIVLEWNSSSEILTYDDEWTRDCASFDHFLIPEGTTNLYLDKEYPSNELIEQSNDSQLKQKLKKLSFFTHYPKEHTTLTINNVTEEYPSKKEKWKEWLEKERNAVVFTFTGTTLTQYSSGSFSGIDMIINYGDGTIETTTGTFDHTYSENGTYTVKIYGITSLGDYCFQDCTGLTSITIPNSVTSIGFSCFFNCTGLTSINIPNSVTSLGGSCFSRCKKLTSINIPNSVTSIGGSCFYSSGLTSITIPNSVTSIGDSCFSGCTGLTSITIPNTITKLGGNCFNNCSSLTSINIPNSVTNLGSYCFYNCTRLRNINIPSSITIIGSNCFKSCTGIVSVTLNWTNPTITYSNSRLSGCTNLTTIYIPHGTKSSYTAKSYPSAKLVER